MDVFFGGGFVHVPMNFKFLDFSKSQSFLICPNLEKKKNKSKLPNSYNKF
jgi:hypothetical protein